MRVIFDHWVSKDIHRGAKFIVKRIEDWKAAGEKQTLGADADEINTPADARCGGECCQMDAARCVEMLRKPSI